MWWTLFALHAVVLLVVMAAAIRTRVINAHVVGDVLALTGALAFFYFKARNARWLRIHGSARSFVVWALLAAFIHPPAFPADGALADNLSPTVVAISVIVAGAALATVLASVRLRGFRALDRGRYLASTSVDAPLLRRVRFAWDARGPPA